MTAWLGLDYGRRRIGIAAGSGTLALSVATHREGRDGSVFTFLRGLAAERGAEGIVVGLPLTADGRETEMAAAVRRFAGRLEEELDLKIVLWDERFSSIEADRGLAQVPKAPTEARDAEAARIILQSYLDSIDENGDPLGSAP